jgi:hypothetical protein
LRVSTALNVISDILPIGVETTYNPLVKKKLFFSLFDSKSKKSCIFFIGIYSFGVNLIPVILTYPLFKIK